MCKTLWAAPALHTARDTPKIAFAPSLPTEEEIYNLISNNDRIIHQFIVIFIEKF
jgi:hypothetical protein